MAEIYPDLDKIWPSLILADEILKSCCDLGKILAEISKSKPWYKKMPRILTRNWQNVLVLIVNSRVSFTVLGWC